MSIGLDVVGLKGLKGDSGEEIRQFVRRVDRQSMEAKIVKAQIMRSVEPDKPQWTGVITRFQNQISRIPVERIHQANSILKDYVKSHAVQTVLPHIPEVEQRILLRTSGQPA